MQGVGRRICSRLIDMDTVEDMPGHDGEVSLEALLGDDRQASEDRPLWLVFDADWYALTYPDAVGMVASGRVASLFEHYITLGQGLEYAPNLFFDEKWYLQTYPDVLKCVRKGIFSSGFHHYAAMGSQAYSPHWLFDEKHYRFQYPEILSSVVDRNDIRNGYGHFLLEGEREGRSGSLFFDPALWSGHSGTYASEQNDFRSFLKNNGGISDLFRASWYFDPVWYAQQYPEVGEKIATGEFSSYLHHYLSAPVSADYSPQKEFSEEFYISSYPDIRSVVEAGAFRNGYQHFLRYGVFEGRNPAPDISLSECMKSSQARAIVESGAVRDAFAYYVSGKSVYQRDPLNEELARHLFLKAAESALPGIAARGLDFTVRGLPDISVVMVLHDQFALTMTALASLSACYAGQIELVLVNSGSKDMTREIGRFVKGARIMNFDYNVNFLDGCNHAFQDLLAPVTFCINNDVRLAPGAIDQALQRLESDPSIGIVGGKIIRTNGLLQEAGSIIWRDGSTLGYLREQSPDLPEANFVRDVDFCSGVFIAVRTRLIHDLNGFDIAYRPAYFEETDFCVRAIQAGWRVVYDPSVVVEHFEFGSSSHADSHGLIQKNWRLFAARQAVFLRNQMPPHTRNAVLARSRRSRRPRVLYIEDRIPLRNLGSGYVRSNTVVAGLAALGCQVSVFPVSSHYHAVGRVYLDFPDTVEVLYNRSVDDLKDFLEERTGCFDIVWIGRTHNLARTMPALLENHRYLTGVSFVLDTEVVRTPRDILAAELSGNTVSVSVEDMLRQEFENAYFCQKIVAVTDADADLIRSLGYENVSVLGHSLKASPTGRSFADRQGILFVGSLMDQDSPNLDSLRWFVSEVFPLVRERLGKDLTLTIAGHRASEVDISFLCQVEGVRSVGAVEDLTELYDSHRVFVAPTRFAGGLPYKIHEAAAHGLPCVASDMLITQLGWLDGFDILSGGKPDTVVFADAVCRLSQDETLWKRIRVHGLTRVEQECSESRFVKELESVISDLPGIMIETGKQTDQSVCVTVA